MNRHGNAYIEYFVLALMVALATLAFFSNGGFATARANVQNAFNASVTTVLAP